MSCEEVCSVRTGFLSLALHCLLAGDLIEASDLARLQLWIRKVLDMQPFALEVKNALPESHRCHYSLRAVYM
eukprot:700761-Amphidinium_carterae.1